MLIYYVQIYILILFNPKHVKTPYFVFSKYVKTLLSNNIVTSRHYVVESEQNQTMSVRLRRRLECWKRRLQLNCRVTVPATTVTNNVNLQRNGVHND